MLSWLVLAAVVVGGYWLLRWLGWKDKPLEEAYGKGAMVILNPTLEELGYSPETAIYSTYRDSKLLSDKRAIAVVGIADHAAGEKRGFAFEVVPGEQVVGGTMLSAPVALRHKERSRVALMSGMPLVELLRRDEEAK